MMVNAPDGVDFLRGIGLFVIAGVVFSVLAAAIYFVRRTARLKASRTSEKDRH